MCGIAGFLGTGGREVLERMTRAISHRGPDAEGYFLRDNVHLGHRRLSIVDLACGAQPMSTPDESTWIVFNGEIYNHAELRKQLQEKGRVFATDHSDTEVLLHGYLEWGEELVNKLNGMWAFAIWDANHRRLFLSRDRFGKKPLYWFFRHNAFAFGSELTALLEHPDSPRGVSRKAIQKLFAYALIPAPHSIIDGIWKLPAGHNMFVEPGSEPRIRRYWRYEIEPDQTPRPENELADELRELLDRAVQRRLMADVPLGVFLSGGIDSTAVAALAVKHVGAGQLRTFSVGFTEPSFDESPYSSMAAKLLGTRHEAEMLDLDRAIECLPQIFDKLDEPQGDNSLLPTWLLSRFTKKHVTVALGGDAGDELFAGYDTFPGLKRAEQYAKLMPKPLHAAVRALTSMLPVSHSNLSLDFKIKRGLRGVSYPAPLWNPLWLGALEPGEIARFTGEKIATEDLYSEAIESWEACEQKNLMDRTLQFYTEIYLQDGILAKVDRASMMHGLEARSPFLDIEVANFARRLPHHFKLRDGTTKYLLKKALEPILPPEILYRKKKGFGTPVGAWFKTGRLELKSTSPFVREKFAAHREGRADERLFLWCQLCCEEWLARRKDVAMLPLA